MEVTVSQLHKANRKPDLPSSAQAVPSDPVPLTRPTPRVNSSRRADITMPRTADTTPPTPLRSKALEARKVSTYNNSSIVSKDMLEATLTTTHTMAAPTMLTT